MDSLEITNNVDDQLFLVSFLDSEYGGGQDTIMRDVYVNPCFHEFDTRAFDKMWSLFNRSHHFQVAQDLYRRIERHIDEMQSLRTLVAQTRKTPKWKEARELALAERDRLLAQKLTLETAIKNYQEERRNKMATEAIGDFRTKREFASS